MTRFWLFGALLFAAVILVYQPAWNAGYIWDDDLYVTKNPLLTAADGLRRIWFSFDAPSQYFPLTYTTFRIEHAFWGFDPAGYHWVNILLHATSALLLWRLLPGLNVRGAWFAAALFALHPVQVESVAWISERKNVLMGFFFLSSLLMWLRFIDEKPKRSWWWLGFAFVLYLLALSAKTTACTLPAALVLILWWKGKPLTAPRWVQILPFLLAGVGAGVISVFWERIHQGGRPDFIPIGIIERILIFSRAIWFYLSKLTWPADLMFSYPRWEISASDPAAYFWPIALAVLIGGIIYARRRLGRGPEVALVFFVATLGPLLGVAIVVTFLFSFVADHYQYLACIGPLALFAAGFSSIGDKRLVRAGTAIILAALGFLTWQQAKMYRNEETLWLRTIAQNPASWMSRNNLAAYWVGEKRFDEAILQYRKIIEQRPDDSLGYTNLGAALARKGDANAAIHEYERALQLSPDDARIERNLAKSLLVLGRIEEATTHLQRALDLRQGRKDVTGLTAEIGSELGDALVQKGNELLQRRELENSVANYRRAIALRPNFPEAHSNLGTALLLQGNFAEAMRELETTLALAPQSVATLNTLARLLATVPDAALRDGPRAARLARQAIDLSRGRDPVSFRALATALAEQGEFAEAEEAADRAISLAGGNAAFAGVVRGEREAYRKGEKAPAR